MSDDQNALLADELSSMQQSAEVLRNSYDRCKVMVISGKKAPEELERLEALTSRFARLSDLLVQKVLRTIDIIELEDNGSVLDRLNRAEKRGVIVKAETLVHIRRLRNRIAHEYERNRLEELFSRTLVLTPNLLDIVERTSQYCRNRFFPKEED